MMKMETKNYVLWMYGVKKRTNSICQFEMQNFFKITKFSLLLNFFILTHSLRKKTSYSELFWSAFSPHFPVFNPNVGKCGKNADQNNSEYGHFLRSDLFSIHPFSNS